MICAGCGNQKAYRQCCWHDKDEQGNLVWRETCDQCGNVGLPWVPDVFWDGKPEVNLADMPDGSPRVFGGKVEKALYLKERGISEVGDSHHGAPWKPGGPAPVNGREMARKALAEVRKMGREYRKQEYQRIVKEGHHG